MSSSLNLKPLNFPQSFDPKVHFALPEIAGARLTLTGDKKEFLRMLGPECGDARLNNVANVLRQGSCRVEATIRTVKEAHQKLHDNAIVSPTARMEAETALLTFVARVTEKVAKNLNNPFSLIGSHIYGGISQFTAIQNALTAELQTSSICAQQEQIAAFSPYCALLTETQAAKALKEALVRSSYIEKGFMFRMDSDKASTFYLVEGVKRRNEIAIYKTRESVINYNIRESVITLHEGKYTLTLTPFDPQHTSFEGTRASGEKKNEWKDFFSLMTEFREKYGTPISTVQLLPPEEISVLLVPSLPESNPAAESSVIAVGEPLQRVSSSTPAPVAQPSPIPLPQLADLGKVDSLQKAVVCGLCNDKIGPLGASREMTKHRTTLKIDERGPVNFMLRKDITGFLYIHLQLCTSVGEFSEDFNFKQLEFEITRTGSNSYTISDDADVPFGKPWPCGKKQWDSFSSMIQYFTTNCGTPIYAGRS